MRSSARGALMVAVGLGLLTGCAGDGPPPPEPAPTQAALPPAPTYETLAFRFNDNGKALDRLWARATVVVDTRTEDGGVKRDQGEGHLQWIRPDRLSLSVGKLGEEGFYLGSNADRYWWLDLVAEPTTAFVGRHEFADARAADGFGLPVHPLDLAELLGLAMMPERPAGAAGIGPGVPTVWSDDGRLAVTEKRIRSGRARLFFEPTRGRLHRAELYDMRGRLFATSDLSRFQQARMIEDGGDWPWMATRIDLRVFDPEASADAAPVVEAVLSLYGMENRGSRQRDIPFDFERLARALRVGEVVDLDERAAGG